MLIIYIHLHKMQKTEMQSKLYEYVEHFIRFITVNSDSKHVSIQTLIDEARNYVDSTVFKEN